VQQAAGFIFFSLVSTSRRKFVNTELANGKGLEGWSNIQQQLHPSPMMMVAPTDRQQPSWVQQAEIQILFLWVFLYLGGTKSCTPSLSLNLLQIIVILPFVIKL
jgi:peptidoglycan/LPS O-acetylase OafA/YrhL